VLFALLPAWLGAQGGYHPVKKIPIPGDYGWDYLTADSEGRRLYVSHDREVAVLDLDSFKIVGKIPGQDVHGIAIARDLGRGYISCSDPGSVIIFDLKTLAVVERVPVGADPNAIFFDKQIQRVYTADRGSKRVTAIDAKTAKIVAASDDLGGRTEHAASDEAGHIYLNMQDRHTLLKLDSKSLKVLNTWPLAPCEQPSSMDMDRVHERVFIGCRSGVMTVVEGGTGRIVTTQPIGKGVDATEYGRYQRLGLFLERRRNHGCVPAGNTR
jgi:DNA-binding beta-propeller fold protein YncE